jgi:cbb3-type cytochrome oxidase subunit 3
MKMEWQQWLYVIFTVFMGVSLYGFLFFLYGSREMGSKIERRGTLIFTDDPLEPR